MGFLGLDHPRLLGTEERDGKRVYRIEEVPAERWYYARIVSVVSAELWLPLEREYVQENKFRVEFSEYDWRLNDLTDGGPR